MSALFAEWPFAVVFIAVFLLNLLPAFAPPTWMALSVIGFTTPELPIFRLALTAAVAATAGRYVLAKMARWLVRGKMLSQETRANIDEIRSGLEGRKAMTAGVFLFYAFSPLPSNYLFLAYGLTSLGMALVSLPFFFGRLVSYSFFVGTAHAANRRFDPENIDWTSSGAIYFLASQALLLPTLWLFTRLDWGALFNERKLRLKPKEPVQAP